MIRETERIQRLAIKRIKGSELKEKDTNLNRLQDALQDVNNKITVEREKAEEEVRTQVREEKVRNERMKADQEMREIWKRSEEIRVKTRKERAEGEAKKACEAEGARKAQEEQERVRKAAAAERYKLEAEQARRRQEEQERVRKAAAAERYKLEAEQARRRQEEQESLRKASVERDKKLAEERIRATHAAKEAALKARAPYGSSHAPNSTRSNCRHDRFWPKVEGKQQCSNCSAFQNWFAFQCPGCGMVACADCRQTLRGEVRKGHNKSRRLDKFEEW